MDADVHASGLTFVEFARSKQVDRLHKGICIWLADATYMLYDTD